MDQEHTGPGLLKGLLGGLIPLAVALSIASIAGFLVYLFWFGTAWIFD